MSFVRQLIERKISDATGATVTFDDFHFSPMSGSIELIGVKVAVERFATPFLSVERIEAKVAVTRALKGEIVVKSMTIERPSFVYHIRSDGTVNLPQKPKAPAETAVPKEGSAGGAWEFDADRISLNHGRVEYHDSTRDNYVLSIEGINATLAAEGSDVAVTLTADSLGRRDRPADLGTVKLLGKLVGPGFRHIMSCSLSSRASIADSLVVQITSSLIANRAFDLEVAGNLKLATLLSLLPTSPAPTWAVIGHGMVDLRASLAVDLLKSIRVGNLEVKGSDVSIERTFGHHGSG